MEKKLFIVASHFDNGPDLWVRSSLELAKEKAIELLRAEAVNMGEPEDEDVIEMTRLLDEGDVFEANKYWHDWQVEAEDDRYIEAILVYPVDLDGDCAGKDITEG